jgi:hypothetical protein
MGNVGRWGLPVGLNRAAQTEWTGHSSGLVKEKEKRMEIGWLVLMGRNDLSRQRRNRNCFSNFCRSF